MGESSAAVGLRQGQFTDRVFGVLILVLGVSAIVFTRSIAVMLPVLAAATAAGLLVERLPLKGITTFPPAVSTLAALLCFAGISALWSADASITIAHSALFLFMLLLGHLLAYWVSVQPVRRIRHLAYWLPIAILIGVAGLTIEVLSDQGLRRILMGYSSIFNPPTLGKHYKLLQDGSIRIANFELNRSIAAANMLLWPAVLCAASYWNGKKFALFALALVGGVMLATAGSTHETSKIAALCGVIAFAVAYFGRRLATAGAMAAWSIVVLGIVPLAIVAHDYLHLQDASWMQNSARARILIWNEVAETITKAPILGVGARTGYVLNERKVAGTELSKVPRHAHNVYLQTWYELGLVGAILLLAVGIMALRAISALPDAVYPFALAAFAVGMVELATSWEIWQRWFFMLYILTWFCLALGIRGVKEKPEASAP